MENDHKSVGRPVRDPPLSPPQDTPAHAGCCTGPNVWFRVSATLDFRRDILTSLDRAQPSSFAEHVFRDKAVLERETRLHAEPTLMKCEARMLAIPLRLVAGDEHPTRRGQAVPLGSGTPPGNPQQVGREGKNPGTPREISGKLPGILLENSGRTSGLHSPGISRATTVAPLGSPGLVAGLPFALGKSRRGGGRVMYV